MTETNTSFFMNAQAAGFGTCGEEDEKLHRELNRTLTDPALTETQFLGFSVPEARIHSLCYAWAHPTLRTITGGVWAWQGVKRTALASELFDMRQYMDFTPFEDGDFTDLRLPSGYRVECLKPLEKFRMTYDDPARGNAFDVTLTAIMPPAVLPSGRHLDQAMRAEGKLLLRGKSYDVNGYTVRDRSWGENRTEEPRMAPPVHWLTGVFGDDFAFHMMGIEHPSSDPVWRDVYPVDDAMAEATNRGWVWVGGELRSVEKASVRTRWDVSTGYPLAHEVRMTDSAGREYRLSGEITASNNWSAWSNAFFGISLARWDDHEGRTGWGDSQIGAWTDFVHALSALEE
ncbi:hypothetical protein ORV05_25565 [Amycolatopsis cynarae]|uniref:DUF7064 domain-containing protein n=1 Tax=Amycolatopsis cynarae TaxID=2995223 RepID=A0ABY7AZ53_9PSEU|nr:hypothetical protein [Amycolatopsis sp. HUAS 11-8]WAL64318.1 hypothetical protein ORV05_25565 [Amycolatopsis sp. HUAS 11-8]